MKSPVNLRKFWIRKDREQFLLSGFTLAAMVASYVTSYWHYQDKLAVHQKMKINAQKSQEAQQKALKEVQFMPSKLHSGTKQYYKVDSENGPVVPKPGEEEEDN